MFTVIFAMVGIIALPMVLIWAVIR